MSLIPIYLERVVQSIEEAIVVLENVYELTGSEVAKAEATKLRESWRIVMLEYKKESRKGDGE